MPIEAVRLEAITVDPTLSIRDGDQGDGLNEARVKEFAQPHVFASLDPILLYRLAASADTAAVLLLVDGRHRYAAAQRLGRAEVLAKIVVGSRQQAEDAAILANAKHGLPYTQTEKRRGAERLLRAHSDWSDNYIAQQLGVSPHTVNKVRQQLEAAGTIVTPEKTLGADGKSRTPTYTPRQVVASTPPPPPPTTVPAGLAAAPLPTGTGEPSPASQSEPAEGQGLGLAAAAPLAPGDGAGPPDGGLAGPLLRAGAGAGTGRPPAAPALDLANFPLQATLDNGQSWEVHAADVAQWSDGGRRSHGFMGDAPYHLSPVDYEQLCAQMGERPLALDRAAARRGFLGEAWDGGDLAFRPVTWRMVAEHLLPGAFLFVNASPRNDHLVRTAMEQAGLLLHPTIFDVTTGLALEIPALLLWLTGQGMNKGSNASKRIRQQGARTAGNRLVVGSRLLPEDDGADGAEIDIAGAGAEDDLVLPVTAPVARWFEGYYYGIQSYRPNAEVIIVAQVPYEGKPLDSIMRYGAGTLGVQRARVGSAPLHLDGGAALPVALEEGGLAQDFRLAAGRLPSNIVVTHTPWCEPAGEAAIRPLDGPRKTPVQEQADGHIPFSHKPVGYQKVGYTGPDGLENITAWACLCACQHCGALWTAVQRHPCPECGSPAVEWRCPAKELDEQSGTSKSTGGRAGHEGAYRGGYRAGHYRGMQPGYLDTGGASRYYYNNHWFYEIAEGAFWLRVAERLATTAPAFYTPKAGAREKEAGLRGYLPCVVCGGLDSQTHRDPTTGKEVACQRNNHKTVKPLALALHLATLLRVPDMYDPSLLNWWSGSGTEACAAILAGFKRVVAVENVPRNCAITALRLRYWSEWARNPDREQVHRAIAQQLAALAGVL